MDRIKAPRSVFINFPLGHQCGKPNDPQLQDQILMDTLSHLTGAARAGDILDLPYEWPEPFDWACYLNDVKAMVEAEGQLIQNWKPKG